MTFDRREGTTLRPYSDYRYAETCKCPNCGVLTHPEYLRCDRDWFVVGCSSCVDKRAVREARGER